MLTILLLNLALLNLPYVGADARSSPKQSLEGSLENLVKKLESRLRDLEIEIQDDKEKQKLRLKENEKRIKSEKEKHAKEKKELEDRLEAKDKEVETRLQELADKTRELERKLKASISELRMEVKEESFKKESASNFSNSIALTKPSLRDLPIVIISAWQPNAIRSPRTVSFESFLANYNNGNRPGGGSGELDLDSGIFTCITPGYYTVSFSAYTDLVFDPYNCLYLYKNGVELPESRWFVGTNDPVTFGVTGSRILILHLDAGDTLELRMTMAGYINRITLNIELLGLGFD